jgi:hypothetical protein
MTSTTQTTWTELDGIIKGNAAAHRFTGGRTAAARTGTPSPLGQWVTEETALDGYHDRYIQERERCFGLQFGGPSPTTCAKLIGAATYRQEDGQRQVSLAVTGLRNGRGRTTEGVDQLELVQVEDSGLAKLEAAQEVAACLALLPLVQRDTAVRLMTGQSAPVNINGATWRRRIADCRAGLREIMLAR